MTIRREEKITWLAILLVLGLIVFAILDTLAAVQAQEPPVAAEPYTYPEIPQCDLELWDRIRYLCPQEGDNNE